MHGGNGSGDSGLVLSTDAKPRLKWTPDLHERFIEAVNQLGRVRTIGAGVTIKQYFGPAPRTTRTSSSMTLEDLE